MNDAHASNGRRPSVVATLALIFGAAVFMTVFFYLLAGLRINLSVFGLLFLVYWAGILEQDLTKFFPALCGGLLGVAIAWSLMAAPALLGHIAIASAALSIATLLFCLMRGHLAVLVNTSTMLFLTIATIPALQVERTALDMAASLVFGALYMGSTTLVIRYVRANRAGSDLTTPE